MANNSLNNSNYPKKSMGEKEMSCAECNPEAIVKSFSPFKMLSKDEVIVIYWRNLGKLCPYCNQKLKAPHCFLEKEV